MSDDEKLILDHERVALVIVDMQNDFCSPDGALYVGDQVKPIIEPIKLLAECALKSGVKVVFTQDFHDPSDEEFNVWPRHCVAGTDGAEIIGELPHGRSDYVVHKTRYTAFHGTGLRNWLEGQKQIDTLIIVGVVTNICVLHTASDAALLGYRIMVPKDCTAALTDYDKEYALHHIEFLFRGDTRDSRLIEFE